ncbi:hypothetical protein LCGC14_1762270 [marine sediment metagenome]|uniref:Uncharacterized protein n=1 Tax=marine sediment metagenome TaxID=412755 RepID=A0A0F9HN10_9ZZZZ
MNGERRKKLETAWSILEGAAEYEQDALDNLPESIQDSDAASSMQDNVDEIYEAAELIRNAIDR